MPGAIRQDARILISVPAAETVCAIGEFNNWSTVATPLTKAGKDEWELSLPSGVELAELGFFVIPQGARTGRVLSQWDLICP